MSGEFGSTEDQTIQTLVNILEFYDKDTGRHCRRVAKLAVWFGRECGVSEHDLNTIRLGALLHDIGKIGIPNHILKKPSPLNEDEWFVMRMHPEIGYRMLASLIFLGEALQIVYLHHEHWNGSGYPNGLDKLNIPLPTRIVTIVEMWDSLRKSHPYRPAYTDEEALMILRSKTGTYFDPELVELFTDRFLQIKKLSSPAAFSFSEPLEYPFNQSTEQLSLPFQKFSIEEKISIERNLKHRLEMERMVSEISSRFISLPIQLIPDEIIASLEALTRFVNADRCFLSIEHCEDFQQKKIYQWQTEHFSPLPSDFEFLSGKKFPWCSNKLINLEIISVNYTSGLPAQAAAERQVWSENKMGAVLLIPLMTSQMCIGVIGFACADEGRIWTDQDIVLLRLSGEIITSVVARQNAEIALRQQQRELHAVLDNIPGILYFKDTTGSYRLVNNNMVRFLNRPLNEIIGKTDQSLFPPAFATKFQMDDAQVIQNAAPLEIKEESVPALDTLYIFSTRKVPLKNEQGEVIGLVGHSLDITDHKNMETALRQSEEKFRSMFDISPYGMVLMDLTGNVVECNPAAFQMAEFNSRDEFIGHNFLEFFADQDSQFTQNLLIQLWEKQTIRDIEVLIRTCRNRLIQAEISFSIIRDSADNPYQLIAVFNDITQRKKTEDALVNSERRYRELVEKGGEGTAIIDPETRFTYVNYAGETIFELARSELLGKCLYDYVDANGKATLEQNLLLNRKGQKTSFEISIFFQDRSPKVLLITGTSQFDSNGTYTGTFITFRDITARKVEENYLRYASMHDALTGLYNRRSFEEHLQWLQNSDFFPISLIMIDLDGLKKINDTYGHQCGDEMLIRFARVLQNSFREEDIISRIGGDEFAVIMPRTSHPALSLAIQRLKQNMDNANQFLSKYFLHFSSGGATAEKGDSLADILQQADHKMYREKNQNRSQA